MPEYLGSDQLDLLGDAPVRWPDRKKYARVGLPAAGAGGDCQRARFIIE